MLYCIFGWAVPDILKDCNAFFFKVRQTNTVGLPDPEDEDIMIHQNSANYLANDKA